MSNQTVLEVSGKSITITRNHSTIILYLASDNDALTVYDYMARCIRNRVGDK